MERLEQTRWRADVAALRFQFALIRKAVLELKYRPDQPRVAAGSPGAGQWTGDDDSSETSLGDDSPQIEGGVYRPGADSQLQLERAVQRVSRPVDLRAEEEQGGHALEHGHVGVPNAALISRLEKAQYHVPGLSFYQKAQGSFNDVDTANAYVNDVLQASPEQVNAVATGQVDEWTFLRRYRRSTGREAYRVAETENSAILIRPTFWVFVKLKHTGTGKGFVVTTAYPTNGEGQE